jgi:hypothetical protein
MFHTKKCFVLRKIKLGWYFQQILSFQRFSTKYIHLSAGSSTCRPCKWASVWQYHNLFSSPRGLQEKETVTRWGNSRTRSQWKFKWGHWRSATGPEQYGACKTRTRWFYHYVVAIVLATTECDSDFTLGMMEFHPHQLIYTRILFFIIRWLIGLSHDYLLLTDWERPQRNSFRKADLPSTTYEC